MEIQVPDVSINKAKLSYVEVAWALADNFLVLKPRVTSSKPVDC